MKIAISNRQSRHRIDMRRIARLTAYLAGRASARAPAGPWNRLSLVLTDDALIRDVNARFRHRLETTDVIAFACAPMPIDPDRLAGEIFVNVQCAVAEGSNRLGASPSDELALYIAHGCDHLSGEDDDTPARSRRMRRRELAWLRRAARLKLIDKLVATGGNRRAGGRKAFKP